VLDHHAGERLSGAGAERATVHPRSMPRAVRRALEVLPSRRLNMGGVFGYNGLPETGVRETRVQTPGRASTRWDTSSRRRRPTGSPAFDTSSDTGSPPRSRRVTASDSWRGRWGRGWRCSTSSRARAPSLRDRDAL
jgi:hypothetical protein